MLYGGINGLGGKKRQVLEQGQLLGALQWQVTDAGICSASDGSSAFCNPCWVRGFSLLKDPSIGCSVQGLGADIETLQLNHASPFLFLGHLPPLASGFAFGLVTQLLLLSPTSAAEFPPAS